MTKASKKRMEELYSSWWFIVGGSIHGIWKKRQWSSLKEFAKNVPRMGLEVGYLAGMQDPEANSERIKQLEGLLGECEGLLQIAEKNLFFEGSDVYESRITSVIGKLKAAKEGGE